MYFLHLLHFITASTTDATTTAAETTTTALATTTTAAETTTVVKTTSGMFTCILTYIFIIASIDIFTLYVHSIKRTFHIPCIAFLLKI